MPRFSRVLLLSLPWTLPSMGGAPAEGPGASLLALQPKEVKVEHGSPGQPPPWMAPLAGKRFNVEIHGERAGDFIQTFAKRGGVPVHCLGDLFYPVSLRLQGASFEEVLDAVLRQCGLERRWSREGILVGHGPDLLLLLAGPEDSTEIEVPFPCHHLDASSLSSVLQTNFPTLKIAAGPKALTPSLSASNGQGGTSGLGHSFFEPQASAVNPLGTSLPLMSWGASPTVPVEDHSKRFEITLKGPVNLLRRALNFARRLDRPRRQVRINVSLTEMSTTAARDLGISWDLAAGVNGGKVTLSERPDPSLGGYEGNQGLRFGALGHSPLSAGLQLKAAEENGMVRTLANPSLLVLDGEHCSLLLGDRFLYPKQTGLNAQGLAIYDVAELKAGVFLQMAVQIGVDDDVIITAYPQNSFESGQRTYNGANYPIISTREAQTSVRLKSGEMLAIGGLRQDIEKDQGARLPLLGRIPGLRWLFGNRSRSRNRTELVLVIQPEIIEDKWVSRPSTLEVLP